MRQFSLLTGLLVLGLVTLTFNSCNDDSTDGDPKIGPKVTLTATSDLTNLFQGDTLKLNLTSTKGDNPLKTFTVRLDGSALDFNKFFINGTKASANPTLLFNSDKNGITNVVIGVLTKDLDPTKSHSVEIEVADDAAETAKGTVTFTLKTFTALTNTFTAKIINNAAGPNDGGLDLLTGNTVAGGYEFPVLTQPAANCSIRDRGLDGTAGNPWKRVIQGVNGFNIRLPKSTSPELFKFDNITNRESLIKAWEAGVTPAADNQTSKLNVNDVFLVNKGDNYFIVTITAIDDDNQSGTGKNLDKYTVSVKTSVK